MSFPRFDSARRRARFSLGVLGVLALLLISPSSAFAHAQLINTYPQANSVLTKAPAQISLTWGEKVQTNSDQIVLADSTGTRVTSTYELKFDSTTGQSTAILIPSKTLPAGSYIVSWRAVSRDGHLVGGAYSFGVNQKPTQAKSTSINFLPR